ncbi:hypothetical protein E4V42_13440 [Clostridium estertheticum]|uniref:Uncharacterized protein n=1 Tax=Clostridium estertheticum TaxID=238834 RepID=A0A5N7J2Y4_9CLOT|nr:hypothetical protein [Clostridium estertheticum]MPQ32435.1 hypothetical protein [Clostridium estertheticum]MPQ63094.1 hypothetical protein [Clostridium estertheticum]
MDTVKYVLNFEEFSDDFKTKIIKLVNSELESLYYPPSKLNDINKLLEEIEKILPAEKYKELLIKVNKLISFMFGRIQKISSRVLDLPPLKMGTTEEFKFIKDIYLTGLHIYQDGWKKNDNFDLTVNNQKLISNKGLKEIGEHVYFNPSYKLVNSLDPILFKINNNSGNSRHVMLDLEYLVEKTDLEIKLRFENDQPGIPQYSSGGPYGSREIDGRTFMCLLGYFPHFDANGGNRSYFIGAMNAHQFVKDEFLDNYSYLNYGPYQLPTHDDALSEESIFYTDGYHNPSADGATVMESTLYVHGYENRILQIYIDVIQYSPALERVPATVDIYLKTKHGTKKVLLQTYNVDFTKYNGEGTRGVCQINMDTLEIIPIQNCERKYIRDGDEWENYSLDGETI